MIRIHAVIEITRRLVNFFFQNHQFKSIMVNTSLIYRELSDFQRISSNSIKSDEELR